MTVLAFSQYSWQPTPSLFSTDTILLHSSIFYEKTNCPEGKTGGGGGFAPAYICQPQETGRYAAQEEVKEVPLFGAKSSDSGWFWFTQTCPTALTCTFWNQNHLTYVKTPASWHISVHAQGTRIGSSLAFPSCLPHRKSTSFCSDTLGKLGEGCLDN